MEMRNSFNRQQVSPNFGMALNISKQAAPFLESLSSKERTYIHNLGKRIRNSRNNIDIEKGGKLSLSYTPKASEIKLVNNSNRKSIEMEAKNYQKNLNSMMTKKEKIDNVKHYIKSFAEIVKNRLSFKESKFIRNLKEYEIIQKEIDRQDALQEVLKERLNNKNKIAKQETKILLETFGDK